jgi:hypothetical protein
MEVNTYHILMMRPSGMSTSRMEYVEAEEEDTDTDRILLFILLKL